MKNFTSKASCALLLSSLVFLPSCEWLKDKLGLTKTEMAASSDTVTGDGNVLATMNGKPLVTVQEFETQFKNLIENHPYGAMLAQMPGIDRQILDGLVGQKVITKYIEDKGINKTPEYKQRQDQLTQGLNVEFFQMEYKPKVTEAEMREFYAKNKDRMPEAIISRGGVNTAGVSFTKEADAKAFLDKVKGNGASLEKVAKESNLGDKFRDFKMVNESSPIDAMLREKIVALKKFPSVELVKGGDNNFYVIYASSKEEPKTRSYDEMKRSVEQNLLVEKTQEAVAKAYDQLKKDYNVTIDESYFAKKDMGTGEQQGAEEQLEMVMPEAPAPAAQAKSTTQAA